MIYENWKKALYYSVKPILPRALQISLRRRYVVLKSQGVRNFWPIDTSSGSKPEGWRGWPSKRLFALVLTHDVESDRGVRKCLRLAQVENELGLLSSFNFVPQKYVLPPEIREELTSGGFEVGVHDLKHDGRLFSSRNAFLRRAEAINNYLESWGAVGFRSGSMFHNLEWMDALRIEYDASTFDTDPFEPQPDGLHTIFPMWIADAHRSGGYVELPYTLAQDLTVFVLLEHKDCRLWKEKLDWIADRGGMALIVTHPDYMQWPGEKCKVDEYPVSLYSDFLNHVMRKFEGQYWNALPMDVARYWRSSMASPCIHTVATGTDAVTADHL